MYTTSRTCRALLRHDDVALLQQMQTMPLVVERTLGSPVKLPLYVSHADALQGRNAVKDLTLLKGMLWVGRGCWWGGT